MADSYIFLSDEKIFDLKKQLSMLEKRMRLINSEQLKRGGLADSWHETASHAVSTNAIESKMYELQRILKRAKKYPKPSNEIAAIGSNVEIVDDNNQKYKYRLVHPLEADPSKFLVSIESPIGKLLIGKSTGVEVKFGERTFRIIKIN